MNAQAQEEQWIDAARAGSRRRRVRGRTGSDGADRPDEPGGVTFTRAELRRKTKAELFEIYKRYFNDEVSPIMWRGLTKANILEMMLDGRDSVTSDWDALA